MKQCSVCIIGEDVPQSLLDSLYQNKEYVREIFTTTPVKNATALSIPSANLADQYNQMIDKASSDYVLFLSPHNQLEEETLEEFAQIAQEYPDADIIYPNEILKIGMEEEAKNYSDWYQKEIFLLPSLAIENYLPQWGVLIKKESVQKLGGFEPQYDEHSWYAFIYKNLPNLRLKLSDLSFVEYFVHQSFIDTSYRSLLVREIISIYPLQKIFTSLNWEKEAIALATANTLIGDRLAAYYDYFNAAKYYRNALLAFHNQESLKKLLEAYYQMGLFEEMENLLQTQEPLQDISEQYSDKIQKTRDLIQEMEKAIQEGKAAQLLLASEDIAQFYQGAPLYNILGVIYHIKKDLQTAYKFFYKAVTMNPLDNDIIHNLVNTAKELHKEEEVIGLITRLTKEV